MEKSPTTRIKLSIEIPLEGKKRLVWFTVEVVGLVGLIAWAIHEIARHF